jgi:DNA-binding NarL/FixJ family response regulator
MDFLMPEMNGLEAARRLTRSNPNILILMITTDPSTELEREAKRAGIRGMCAKDEMHCLVDAIDTLLRGKTYFRLDSAA